GVISYSLYLWHWPVISIANYMAFELTLISKLTVLSIVFVMSVFSYKYIELPFRESHEDLSRVISKYYIAPVCSLIFVALLGVYYKGICNALGCRNSCNGQVASYFL